MRARIITPDDLPPEISRGTRPTNALRINTLVSDIIVQNWHIAYPDAETAAQDRHEVSS